MGFLSFFVSFCFWGKACPCPFVDRVSSRLGATQLSPTVSRLFSGGVHPFFFFGCAFDNHTFRLTVRGPLYFTWYYKPLVYWNDGFGLTFSHVPRLILGKARVMLGFRVADFSGGENGIILKYLGFFVLLFNYCH